MTRLRHPARWNGAVPRGTPFVRPVTMRDNARHRVTARSRNLPALARQDATCRDTVPHRPRRSVASRCTLFGPNVRPSRLTPRHSHLPFRLHLSKSEPRRAFARPQSFTNRRRKSQAYFSSHFISSGPAETSAGFPRAAGAPARPPSPARRPRRRRAASRMRSPRHHRLDAPPASTDSPPTSRAFHIAA